MRKNDVGKAKSGSFFFFESWIQRGRGEVWSVQVGCRRQPSATIWCDRLRRVSAYLFNSFPAHTRTRDSRHLPTSGRR